MAPANPGSTRRRRAAAAAARAQAAKAPPVAPPVPRAPAPSSASGSPSAALVWLAGGLFVSAIAATAYFGYVYLAGRHEQADEVEGEEADVQLADLEEVWETIHDGSADESRPVEDLQTDNELASAIASAHIVEEPAPQPAREAAKPLVHAGGASRAKPQRKMTILTNNMLLKTEASGFSFLPQAISFLERLLEFNAYDVLLITELSSAAEKGQVVDLFSSSSLAASGLFDIRKLLFCTTVDGRVHMVRHLEPVVHVEGPLVKLPKDSPMERLWQFIPRMIRVGRPETALKKTAVDSWDSKPDVPVEGGNVETVDSLMNSSLAKEIGFAKAGSW